MPIYEYVCDQGHRFEVIHGIHDAGPTECPICNSTNVRKAFAAPAIHFKGSGWAKKDRKATSSSPSTAKADAGDDKAPAASGAKEGGAKEGGAKSDGTRSDTSTAASTASSGSGGSSGSSSTPSTD